MQLMLILVLGCTRFRFTLILIIVSLKFVISVLYTIKMCVISDAIKDYASSGLQK
jgi:hypothetical protein